MSRSRHRSPPTYETRPVKRVFTVAEANRALVLVRRIVTDVLAEYNRMLDLQETVEAAEASGAADRCEEARLALIRSAGRLRGYLEELDEIGVEMKDWSVGVVDFPSMAGGRQVFLCWRHGEDRVEHWHELDGGFTCRMSIDSLPADGTYVARRGSAASGHHMTNPGPTRGARTKHPNG